MKIAGTGSLHANAPRRKAGAGDSAAGDFASHINGGGKASTSAVSTPAQIGSVEALIALQSNVEQGQNQNAVEVDRAEDLLDQLDRIRVGILTGRMSGDTLNNIVHRLADRRREGVEPRLAALIDEIELRARVELAKLSMN